jgi:hypothetical protein
MVVETKFRVSRYAQDTPLSLGNQAPSQTQIFLPGAKLPWQTGWQSSRPGINIGIPGVSGFEEYPITDPNPGSCLPGYTRNYLGQCVPIQAAPACPTGFARDSQGNCVQIPVVPVPVTPGMSAQIVQIQLPTLFKQGTNVTIRTWYQNYRSDAPLYAIKINLPGISFTHTTPPVPSNAVGQTVRIDSTFTVPNFAQIAIYPPPPIPGTVSLLRYQTVQCVTTPCNPQEVETADTENINLFTQGTRPTPTPTPTPTPVGRCSAADRKILAKWKELATRFERERARECPGSGLSGQIKCKVKTQIAAAWKKNYQNVARKCGVAATMAAYAYPGYTSYAATAGTSLTVTPTTVIRNGTFVVEGSGYSPQEAVMIEVRIAGRVSRTAQIANGSGQIRKNIRAPNTSGVAMIAATGNRSGRMGTANVSVT